VNAAREEILARVRAAIGGGGAASEAVPRAYRTSGALAAAARVDLLAERLLEYGARVERTDEAALPDVISAVAGAGRLAVPARLPAAWRPSGAVEDHELTPRELDRLDGVVTGCTLAIAETGTLVLAGGPTEGRRALTLVPDLHVCVVGAGQVVETVPEAFAALRELATRPLTFVTGPSATSDIELARVEGVHGPRTLVVVIVGAE
jgi:L-lactate dehydrogenase complex protein LldG